MQQIEERRKSLSMNRLPLRLRPIAGASESHRIYLLDARGQCLGERSVSHGGAELGELCDWLATKTGASPAAIAVAIEVPHGPA
jgi:hypothetical protein